MSTKMQTLSVRISSEDFEWLSALEISGASTPSDKLRALIAPGAQAAPGHDGSRDLRCLAARSPGPVRGAVREVENRHRMHSDAINAVIEWVPQIMATLLSERRFGKDRAAQATDIEAALVQRCFQLFSTLMRLGVTPAAECYDPQAIEKHLPKITRAGQPDLDRPQISKGETAWLTAFPASRASSAAASTRSSTRWRTRRPKRPWRRPSARSTRSSTRCASSSARPKRPSTSSRRS